MTATMTDQPSSEGTTGSTPSRRPPTGPISDKDLGAKKSRISGRAIFWAFVALILVIGAIFATSWVVNRQADKRLKQERLTNAIRDLNNRAQDKSVGGSFTRVYYAGAEMRATFVRTDGLKRCNMRVMPPTDKVLRYSTAGVPATDASFRMLKDPNAIGCLEASGGGGIGGG